MQDLRRAETGDESLNGIYRLPLTNFLGPIHTKS